MPSSTQTDPDPADPAQTDASTGPTLGTDSAAPSGPQGNRLIDPRGPRFAATLTTALLAVALVTAPSALTIALLAAQTVVFGIGAVAGVRRTPYAWLFKTLVRPRLGKPTHLEDPAPPRFAQAVGLVFAVLALVGFTTGVTLLGEVATGLALIAALLNAAFGFCLGCEGYLLLRRLLPRSANTSHDNDTTAHNRAGRIPAL